VVLLSGLVVILIAVSGGMWKLVGNGTLAAMVALTFAAILVGHLFGGPANGQRAALGLSRASPHPAIAKAIASRNFAGEHLAIAAILLFAIVSTIASRPTWHGCGGAVHRLLEANHRCPRKIRVRASQRAVYQRNANAKRA
jgi:BASS family bile acid:Na+ symporter